MIQCLDIELLDFFDAHTLFIHSDLDPSLVSLVPVWKTPSQLLIFQCLCSSTVGNSIITLSRLLMHFCHSSNLQPFQDIVLGVR